MDIFNLFTQYHETAFQEFKKELIKSIKLDIIKLNQKNKHICGYKRTQNRGYCRRLCSGNACKYHLKYIDEKNVIQNCEFISKSDVSDISDDVIIHKDICKNIINRDILSNIKIYDLPKSNIILKYDLKTDINNYIFNFNSKINIFKSLTSFIILYSKIKRKREKKRIKNKNKKERRKIKVLQSHNSHISEIYDRYNVHNGILLQENDKYYTINFYDEKVAADCVEGILCNYCSSIRYTQSGPCINANCYNRTFDDIEFVIYYKKHKKHKKSIYNPFLKEK